MKAWPVAALALAAACSDDPGTGARPDAGGGARFDSGLDDLCARVDLDRIDVDFGPVLLGETGGEALTLTSSCAQTVDVTIDLPRCTSDAVFCLDSSLGPVDELPLRPGASETLSLTFRPEEATSSSEQMEIRWGDLLFQRETIALRGLGTASLDTDIEVIPAQLDFGCSSTVAPSRRTVLVANVGFEDLVIQEIVVDTAGTDAFVSPDAAPATVAPGGAHVVTIEFSPPDDGRVESGMLIRSNDPDEPEVEVRLRGECVVSSACRFEVSGDRPLRLGRTRVGSASRRAFTIENVGTGACLVSQPSLAEECSSTMALAEPFDSLLLSPNASLTLAVSFDPTDAGAERCLGSFGMSNPDSPFNAFAVTATASAIWLASSPPHLDFGQVFEPVVTATVSVRNPESVPASIEAVQLEADDRYFDVDPFAPTMLLPGETLELRVHFTRRERLGDHAGALVLTVEMDGVRHELIVGLEAEIE